MGVMLALEAGLALSLPCVRKVLSHPEPALLVTTTPANPEGGWDPATAAPRGGSSSLGPLPGAG